MSRDDALLEKVRIILRLTDTRIIDALEQYVDAILDSRNKQGRVKKKFAGKSSAPPSK